MTSPEEKRAPRTAKSAKPASDSLTGISARNPPPGAAAKAQAADLPWGSEGEHFSRFALVIDARTPREYQEDHIPGAINLPVVDDDEFAEVGIVHASDPHTAYLIGAAYASKNLATHLRSHIAGLSASDRILVYCFRGGKRSRVWGDTLRNIGFATDVLPGGWKAYRSWVRERLETVPRRFDYRVLSSLTGCGKTRLLQALSRLGAQVLDLEALAQHRGSLLGSLPGEEQPPQKMFDSLLVAKFSSFDRRRPVWIESESKKVGKVQLPGALYEALRAAQTIELRAPVAERVRLLMEEYPHFVEAPGEMVERLAPLKPLVGAEEMSLWGELAAGGQVEALFERVLCKHYDPSYIRSSRRASPRPEDEHLDLPRLDSASMDIAARALDARHGHLHD